MASSELRQFLGISIVTSVHLQPPRIKPRLKPLTRYKKRTMKRWNADPKHIIEGDMMSDRDSVLMCHPLQVPRIEAALRLELRGAIVSHGVGV